MSLLRQLVSACQQQVCRPQSLPVLASYMTTYRQLHTTRGRLQDEGNFFQDKEEREAYLGDEPKDEFFSTKKLTLPKGSNSLVFNGLPFERIPVAHIRVSQNNTIVTVTNPSGTQRIALCSCGTEGFKNAKKSTNVAGQAVGVAAATKALAKGVTCVRVLIRGLGPGRQSSIKGLQMGGLEVISITDNTPVPSSTSNRPRKARRL